MSAPAALVDIDDAASVLGLSPEIARTYLEAQEEPPVAAYRGRSLWLSDTVHQILEDFEVRP